MLKLSDDLSLPDSYVTSTGALLAVRGAGKSNTAAVIAEEMSRQKLPFVVFDPVGAWWGLRSGGDGKSAGLPVPIFGGRHGDVPLEPTAGELVADLVVDERLSAVLDLSQFNSEADKRRFLLAFAQRLYKRNEDPLHLFLEEADDYMPQKPMREQLAILGAFENIVRRGRSRGLGCTFITQRSAVLNKNVLTQTETLFAMRNTSPQDIKAIAEWVKYHDVAQDMLPTLSSLEDGEAWVWSPHVLKIVKRTKVRRRWTFDSGATPKNVKAGAHRPVATMADIDLTSIAERMKATIEKAKAEDPAAWRAELKRQNLQIIRLTNELEAERSKKQTPAPAQLKDSDIARLEKLAETVRTEIAGRLKTTMDAFTARAVAHVEAIARFSKVPTTVSVSATAGVSHIVRPPSPARQNLESPSPRPVGRSAAIGPGAALPPGEKATLIAAAQYADGVTREQASILTGYKRSSRDAYIQRLVGKGLVEVMSDRIVATEGGIAALGSDFEPLPAGEDLQRYWFARLPPGERAVLEVLIGAYPNVVTREAIEEKTGYKRSSRDAYIQRLKARQLVAIAGAGVRASEVLF